MGVKHSTLAPKDGDFAIARPCKVHLSSSSSSTAMRRGQSFYCPRNVWNHVNGQTDDGVVINSLDGIRFIPVINIDPASSENSSATTTNSSKNKQQTFKSVKMNRKEIIKNGIERCLVEDSNGNLLAVMIARHRKIQICTLTPPTEGAATNISESSSQQTILHPDGRQLYERAVVRMHYKNGTLTRDYDIVTPEDGMFVTHFYGKAVSSKRNMVLIDSQKQLVSTLCQVDDNVEEKALATKVATRRDDMTVWKIRTCPGVDQIMMACFAVALDKLKVLFKEEMGQASYVTMGAGVALDKMKTLFNEEMVAASYVTMGTMGGGLWKAIT